jgi:hypothetical protein
VVKKKFTSYLIRSPDLGLRKSGERNSAPIRGLGAVTKVKKSLIIKRYLR